MTITYGKAKSGDLRKIMQIEHSGFSEAEAATDESMLERIQVLNDTFVVAYDEDQPVGYIVGAAYHKRYIEDELFAKSTPNRPTDKYQTVLSLVVDPNYRGLGIAGELLDRLAMIASQAGRQLMSLTCLKELVPFYELHGYQSEGVAESAHAGETWFNMIKPL